jgi:hypothetical protein
MSTRKCKDVSAALLKDFLLGHMAKQCKVARADFLDLVDCPMDRAAYEAKLAAQGIGLTEKGARR